MNELDQMMIDLGYEVHDDMFQKGDTLISRDDIKYIWDRAWREGNAEGYSDGHAEGYDEGTSDAGG